MSKKKWTFATTIAERPLKDLCLDYGAASKRPPSRETKRRMYEKALGAALENFLSWEIAAREDGFDVQLLTTQGGTEPPHAVLDRETAIVDFVQSYGVMVTDKNEGTKQ